MATSVPKLKIGNKFIIEAIKVLNANYDVLPDDVLEEFENTQQYLTDHNTYVKSRTKGIISWLVLTPERYKLNKQAKIFENAVVSTSQQYRFEANKTARRERNSSGSNSPNQPPLLFRSPQVEEQWNTAQKNNQPVIAAVTSVSGNLSTAVPEEEEKIPVDGLYFKPNFSSATLAAASDKLETSRLAARSSGSYHADLEETIHSLEQARIKLAKYKVEIPSDYSAEFKSMFVKNVTTLHQLVK